MDSRRSVIFNCCWPQSGISDSLFLLKLNTCVTIPRTTDNYQEPYREPRRTTELPRKNSKKYSDVYCHCFLYYREIWKWENHSNLQTWCWQLPISRAVSCNVLKRLFPWNYEAKSVYYRLDKPLFIDVSRYSSRKFFVKLLVNFTIVIGSCIYNSH